MQQHPMSTVNTGQLSSTGHRGPMYIEITECDEYREISPVMEATPVFPKSFHVGIMN
jgi:hypothetical protein